MELRGGAGRWSWKGSLLLAQKEGGVLGNCACGSEGDTSSHSRFALVRWLYRRRRRPTPELPVEDNQPDRHDAQHDAIEQVGLRKVRAGGPEPSYRNGPLGSVGHERHEHAAARAVEQPRVPER